ncbi:MAG: helix-turn-helix domain-containing protein [Candidatus Bathyarchaeia archaeon]|nr:helix-turn-helix transcriptional regulator [Candidatus Bathyarchaeota archaeon]
MSEKGAVKVHLEIGDLKVDFEGDSKYVFDSLLHFISQVCPNMELLRKVVYTPDLVNLINEISGLVEISSEGPMLNLNLDLSTRNAVCLALLGAYIGNKIGKLNKDTLSVSDLSKLTGKAKKTVTNELPKLVESGLVEKVYEGEYKITELGIRRTEDIIKAIKGV